MLIKSTPILLMALFLVSCHQEPETSAELTSHAAARGWIWPQGFQRNLQERPHFNINRLTEVAFATTGDQEFRHQSLESLLQDPLFQQYAPSAARNFHAASVYMETSRALFGRATSPEFPRQMTVIGTMVLGINTDAQHQRAYEALEIIDMNPQTAEIDFYMLRFDNGRPELAKNPRACVGCHGGGDEQRYIWQMYNRWPGMMKSIQGLDIPRRLGRQSDISFTIALFEMNLARIAKQLLSHPSYLPRERQVIAALLDCDPSMMGFAAEHLGLALQNAHDRYYADTKQLLDQLNEVGPSYERYTVTSDGVIKAGTIINEKDPVRLGLLSLILADTGIDLATWSISRDRGGSSYLFQSSGGISLSRLAFYLVQNSPNRTALAQIVPNVDRLSHAISPRTPAEVCDALLTSEME